MNRWDEIKGAALDVAQHVTQDPAQRDAMANDLITLIELMFSAVGKVAAGEGERDLNDAHDVEFPWDDGSFDPSPEAVAEAEAERAADVASAHTRYLMGESIQRAAEEVANEGRTADLDRWASMDRDHGKPGNRYGWHPRCAYCGERGACNGTRCVGCGDCDCNGSCCISI